MKRGLQSNGYPRKRAKRDMFGYPPSRQSLARSIRALAETKIKVNEGNFHPTSALGDGTFTHLTNIASGDRKDDRIGDKIHVSYIKLRLNGSLTGNLRVALLCPKVATQDMTAGAIRQTKFTNFDDSIYWVFYDQFFTADTVQNDPSNHLGGITVNVDLSRNQKCEFQGASSAASTLARNPIYLYCYGTNATSANISVDGYAKVYYKDV